VLRHRKWNQQLSEDLKVAEYLGGKAVYERHSCRQNSAVDSVELCQVGIEHRHRVLKKNSVVSSDRRNKITEDSESSARWALSECIGAQEDITAGSSERILCQVGN
jgi:hypothetical protein